MSRVLVLFGLAVFAFFATPSASAAQACDACAYDDGEHWFLGVNCDAGGACKDCEAHVGGHNGCHAAKIESPCYTHPLCDEETAPEDQLLALVETKDADALARVILSGGLYLNLERNALQVQGCTEERGVVAHIPIPEEFVEEIAATLERTASVATAPDEVTGI